MCGFVGAFDLNSGSTPIDQGLKEELRAQLLSMSKKIRHRGPDWSGVWTGENAILSHERLAIVDPLSGKQPLISDDEKIILAVNGEIYNHKEIRNQFAGTYNFKTQSDCEVIIPLYKEAVAKAESQLSATLNHGNFQDVLKITDFDFLEKLSGIFAFALYDSERDIYMIARDEIGVIPLYQGWDSKGHYYVASELKALEGICGTIEEFPNGCYLVGGKGISDFGKPIRWYHRPWEVFSNVENAISATDETGKIINSNVISTIREGLEKAVKQQLMSDVPYGVLLSGGLDSTIIAAVTQKFAKKRIETDSQDNAWWPQLHSFAIGLEGSPDLKAARKAADFIGTVHHEVRFTIQEALDALPDVIYHLETFDITTIRASTPMYLLARVIKSMGIKMVLSGEGSDELFGGYLYFHKAPDPREFHEELVRKMSKLHFYDCLRANKSLSAWGVEGRVPFLDKDFIDIAMSLNPKDKMNIKLPENTDVQGGSTQRIEKWILRKAFEDILPPDLCWRQKEQFSDGVGYSWIDTLKEMTSRKVSDAEFAQREKRFPVHTPVTKEEYYYRKIFESFFPGNSCALTVPHEAGVACSTAKALEWDEAWKKMDEPSGRAISGVHEKAY